MLPHTPSCPLGQEKGTKSCNVDAGHNNIIDTPHYFKLRILYAPSSFIYKKLTGGWKIIQDVCPECDEEDNCSAASRNSRSSRRSTSSKGGQKSDGNYESASKNKPVGGSKGSRRSTPSHVSEGARNDCEHFPSQSERTRAKFELMQCNVDDNEDDGIRPKLSGVRKEVMTAQGKSSRDKSIKKDKQEKVKSLSKSSSKNETGNSNNTAANTRGSDKKHDVLEREINDPKQRAAELDKARYRQRALKEYKDLYESAKVVKNMVFVDVHGDSGRYTGDVNEFRMPHGMGNIIYEHGLVQGGKWVSTSEQLPNPDDK